MQMLKKSEIFFSVFVFSDDPPPLLPLTTRQSPAPQCTASQAVTVDNLCGVSMAPCPSDVAGYCGIKNNGSTAFKMGRWGGGGAWEGTSKSPSLTTHL